MRFRKILLKSRLWLSFRIAQRQVKRLRWQLKELSAEFTREKEKLVRFYEKRLEEERLKKEAALFSMTDRLLQSQKLLTVSGSVQDLGEKAENNLIPKEVQSQDPTETLIGEERNLFDDLKEGFFEAEAENGRSDAEIQRLWDSKFKAQAIEQAKNQILY